MTGCSGGSTSAAAVTNTPAPAVAGISPTSVPAGSPAFTLSVTGSNFQPQSVVNWNGTALATTYTSASALTAAVPASLAATAATATITVANPDGQSSPASSAAQQVAITNLAPALSAVSPQALYAGSPDTTFTLTGTNFLSSSVAQAGTTPLATTLVSSTQLSAVAPAALLSSAGALSFTVSNPAPGGGSSQSVSITVRQPAATLISLSPASVVAGSSPVTVTLTGSYFTPTAVAYVNYSPIATTFVSSTSIQFTIPAQLLTGTGTLGVAVRDPASQSVSSNTLPFQILNPVPVLNSISPVAVTAGAPNFVLTLNGSNFVSSATVLVNGAPVQPSSNPSATTASVVVPASAISALGTVTIGISNPAPGGGASALQTLNVIAASNRIRTVAVAAEDLGWDAAHKLVIASTSSSSASNPNSIVTIDPLQGTIVTAQSLPGQPAGISVTSDDSYVYVTLPATGQIERLTLPTLTPDITFGLGSATGGNFYRSSYVAAAPGQPHTVAVTRSTTAAYGANGGVVVYDDGVPRPAIATPTGYFSFYDALVWGSDATTLYGTNAASSSADEDTFSVTSAGVALLSDRANVLGEFVNRLAFDPQTAWLVDGYGNSVNASTGQSAGQFQVQNTITYEQNPFALDSAQRIAFFLNVNGFYPSNAPPGIYIQAFSLDQFNYINSLLVDGLSSGSTLIRWGTSGLAVNGSSQIYLVDGSFVSPAGVSSSAGGYVAVSPTLTSVTPSAVTAGSSAVQVTLSGRDFTQAAVVAWNNQALTINSVSSTQIVVTLPASLLTTAVASSITVTNGPGTGGSGPLAFSVLPNLGQTTRIAALDISGQDLVWDSTHSLLYVAVPASDPASPNSIAVVDPAQSAINQTIPTPGPPIALSLSGDGQFLYSGFSTQAVVQRYALPSFSLNLTIPTGAGLPANTAGTHGSCTFPVDVKVAPGYPHSIAVTEGNVNIEPRGCGGVAIYDDTTPRAGTLILPGDDFSTLAWGADATTLFSQSDPAISPQALNQLAVSPSGVTLDGPLNGGGLGLRVHFDTGTNLLYSDSGVITNPVGPAQVGKFSAGGLVVTDSTLNRAYVLTTSAASGSGLGAASYTLDIFNLNTQALLSSIVIPDVLGYPMRLTRWGSNGIAFVTTGQSFTTGSAGVLYILQGSGITP